MTIWYAHFYLSSVSLRVSPIPERLTLFAFAASVIIQSLPRPDGRRADEYTTEYTCTNVLLDGQSSSWVLTLDPNFLKCDINGHKSSYSTSKFFSSTSQLV